MSTFDLDDFNFSPEAVTAIDEEINKQVPGFKELPDQLKAVALFSSKETFAKLFAALTAQAATLLTPRELVEVVHICLTVIMDFTSPEPAYSELGNTLHEHGDKYRAMLKDFREIRDLEEAEGPDAA